MIDLKMPNIPWAAVTKVALYTALPVVVATGDDYYELAKKYIETQQLQAIPDYEMTYLKFKTAAAGLAGFAASLTRSIKDEYKIINKTGD